jgi:hypothetical protein
MCTPDEYESTPATPTSDRVCTGLTMCTPDEYESTPATPTSNRVCTGLTPCESDEYESVPPTPTSDRVCTVIPTLEIDIRPTSTFNPINVNSNGVVPVAILGSDTFDVTLVDVTTLMFGSAAPVHDGHIEDVNGDGYDDLVTHYKQKDLELCVDVTELTINGELLDGTPFEGTDSVIPLHADC